MIDQIDDRTDFYVVGGTMKPDAPSYIQREADQELYEHILKGNFCYVLTPRQMGKSSLMARTSVRLKKEGVRTAIIDLTQIGTEKESADRWYYGIAYRIAKELKINIKLKVWWEQRENLSALQRLLEFFEDALLSGTNESVVIFVDEIDTTIALPFTDDFFAAVRACYNARATKIEYQRLNFVLLGVAGPSDLIKDTQRTPFNIGHGIHLTDFTPEEAKPLSLGLCADPEQGEKMLARILYWTGGHPYLTQKLCRIIVSINFNTYTDEVVDNIVEKYFLRTDAHRKDDNIANIYKRLEQKNKYSKDILKLYISIYDGQSIKDEPLSRIHMMLKLSGLVVSMENRHLYVRNHIYKQIFTKKMVKEVIPTVWTRENIIASISLIAAVISIIYFVIAPELSKTNESITSQEFLPIEYIKNIRSALYDVPISQYEKLRKIPGYTEKADILFADYWDRRALHEETFENREEALLFRLKALKLKDTVTRRCEIGRLVGIDYKNLVATYRCEDSIHSAVFSLDGKIILTGTSKGGVILWRTVTGQPFGKRIIHESYVDIIKFSPDGKMVLTSSWDKTVRLWKFNTWEPLGKPMVHDSNILAAAFSPDSKNIFTGSENAVSKWRTDTGELIAKIIKNRFSFDSIDFSRGGKLVLTASYDWKAPVRLVDIETGEYNNIKFHFIPRVDKVALNSNGMTALLCFKDSTAQLWRVDKNEPIGFPIKHEDRINEVLFSPNGQKVLTCSEDETARLWQTDTGELIGNPLKHESNVVTVAFSPNGKYMLTCDYRVSRLWKVFTEELQKNYIRHEGFITYTNFSPDGQTLLTFSSNGTVQLWRTLKGEPIGKPLKYESSITSTMFSPDGQTVLTVGSAGTIQLWRTVTGEAIGKPMKHEGSVSSVIFSPDGRTILTSSGWIARLWRSDSGEAIGKPMRHDFSVRSVLFSPNGQKALTGSGGSLRLWRVDTGESIGNPMNHESLVTAIAFSPNGETVLAGYEDGTAQLWQIDTFKTINKPMIHKSSVSVVAYTKAGKTMLTGSDEGVVRLWKVDSCKQIGEQMDAGVSINFIEFSPNRNLVLTGDRSNIKIFRSDTGSELRGYMYVPYPARNAALSPTGKTIMAATDWSIHQGIISKGELKPKASRLLPGKWIGAYHFLDDVGDRMQVALKIKGDSIKIINLRFDKPDAPPIEGDPAELLELWQKKLALRLDEKTGKIEPMYPLPEVKKDLRRSPSVTKGEEDKQGER